jgi:hypothetical protein
MKGQRATTSFIVPSVADCVFIMALLIATLVWARPALNTDGDAGRHIRVGETILQRGGLFHEDLFSHTMAGERFVGLCRLDSGLMKAERLVSQEGLQPVG